MPTEEKQKTIKVFCANEQTETDHVLDMSGTGEIVLTCDCGRFLKFPKGTTPSELKEKLEEHAEANEGQVTMEAMEAEKDEILKEFED